jgi:hypothetical protein
MSDDAAPSFRPPTAAETELLRALIARPPDLGLAPGWIDGARVRSMDDGGMGSFRISAGTDESEERAFGAEVARLEFADEDGVLVSVTLNVDCEGLPFEVDVWNVDYSPFIRVPEDLPAAARFDRRSREEREADEPANGRAADLMPKFWKIVVLALLAVGITLWYRQCVVIDSCLDLGGAWDYEQDRCVREAPETAGGS